MVVVYPKRVPIGDILGEKDLPSSSPSFVVTAALLSLPSPRVCFGPSLLRRRGPMCVCQRQVAFNYSRRTLRHVAVVATAALAMQTETKRIHNGHGSPCCCDRSTLSCATKVHCANSARKTEFFFSAVIFLVGMAILSF